jgi:hypothetical protein
MKINIKYKVQYVFILNVIIFITLFLLSVLTFKNQILNYFLICISLLNIFIFSALSLLRLFKNYIEIEEKIFKIRENPIFSLKTCNKDSISIIENNEKYIKIAYQNSKQYFILFQEINNENKLKLFEYFNLLKK